MPIAQGCGYDAKSLAVVMTALAELHQDLQVAPLFAAFLVHALKNGNFDFVLALLQEDHLPTFCNLVWK